MLQPGQNEAIHHSERPALIPDRRDLLAPGRFPNPRQQLLAGGEIEQVRFQRRSGDIVRRPGRPFANPPLEISQDCIRQFWFLRRHGQVFVTMRHCREQETRLRFPWDDGRPRIASLQKAGRNVHTQAALEFLARRAVALVAILSEDRPDFLFEKFHLGSRGPNARRQKRRRECNHKSCVERSSAHA